MSSIRFFLIQVIAFMILIPLCCARSQAQAALLLEEPYGFFGLANPTGHTALYMDNVCAETPVKLRRCRPGEMGVVISRYHGIDHYDWVAIPLVPYLYSVENLDDVPARANAAEVMRMRERYREAELESLGPKLSKGNLVRAGWTQLLGQSYDRRIYALRFNTTRAQEDELIEELNDSSNHSHFSILFNNCADFAEKVLDDWYPGAFHRALLPDAGIATPKQTTHELVKYASKHPELNLQIYEIPQVPGSRRHSIATKDVAQSLTTTGYAVPIVLLNPYLAGGLFVDYLASGEYHDGIPKHPTVLGPDELTALTAPTRADHNPGSAVSQAHGAATGGTE
jgi:hypothetical protein